MAMATGGGKGVMVEMNVTPLIDVLLVLIITFMVVTPMLQKTYNVDMAKAANPRDMPDADKDDAIVIAVTRDGKEYIGNTFTPLDQITTKVKDMVADQPGKTVYIKSDARAKYGDVVKVVDNVRAAGVESLGLLTQRLTPASAGAPVSATP